jgi:hypothetical protein
MTPQTRQSSTLSYSWVSLLRKLMIRGAWSMRMNKPLSIRVAIDGSAYNRSHCYKSLFPHPEPSHLT